MFSGDQNATWFSPNPFLLGQSHQTWVYMWFLPPGSLSTSLALPSTRRVAAMSATLEEGTVTKDLLEFWSSSEPITVMLEILASAVFDYPQTLKHQNFRVMAWVWNAPLRLGSYVVLPFWWVGYRWRKGLSLRASFSRLHLVPSLLLLCFLFARK